MEGTREIDYETDMKKDAEWQRKRVFQIEKCRFGVFFTFETLLILFDTFTRMRLPNDATLMSASSPCFHFHAIFLQKIFLKKSQLQRK